MATLIDTNVILRYLLADNQEMYEQAVTAIQDGARTLPESIAEVVYVLTKVYGLDRSQTAEAVKAVPKDIGTDHRGDILEAIEIFRTSKLDYVDCLYAATVLADDRDFITYDKKLDSYIRHRRAEDD